MKLSPLRKQLVQLKLDRFCAYKRAQEPTVHYRIRGIYVTLYRRAAAPRGGAAARDVVVAQFRFDPGARTWSLYVKGPDGGAWHAYPAGPREDLDELLHEVDRDPAEHFWSRTAPTR